MTPQYTVIRSFQSVTDFLILALPAFLTLEFEILIYVDEIQVVLPGDRRY